MAAEETLHHVIDALVLVVEGAGATVVFAGAVIAFVRFLWVAVRERLSATFAEVRIDFGYFLLLGLDFQLASDVLRTAISPTLRQIGELAAIAAIRTALNFFLTREIADAMTDRDEVGR